METNREYIITLIIKYLKNELNDAVEQQDLQVWLSRSNKNQKLLDDFKLYDTIKPDLQALSSIDEKKAWSNVERSLAVTRTSLRDSLKTWFVRVASIVALLTIYSESYRGTQSGSHIDNESLVFAHNEDIDPASQGARLFTADGKIIELNDELEVDTAGYASFQGEKQLLGNDAVVSSALVFNTLEVPKGRFFKIFLPDGTTVWINSMSELRFPTRFAHDNRTVYLKGEAYFDVVRDEQKPFIVESNGSQIEVLGTEFNVRSYDKLTKTTLKSGKVRLTANGIDEILSPGNYGTWNGTNFRMGTANLNKDLAWKNNEFYFQNDNIIQIAQQLMLWYDVEINLEPNVSRTKTYTGAINRDVSIKEVLKMLQFVSNLKFELKNNSVLIKD